MLTQLTEQINNFNKLRQKLNEEIKLKLTGIFQNILSRHPKITTVKWNQYTNYFNDGDPCTFSVRDYYVYDQEENETDSWELRLVNPELKEELDNVFGTIPDEFFESTFGDHTCVEITKDSVDISNYHNHS